MPKIILDLPESVFSALRRSPQEFGKEMQLAAAIHWYQKGLISQEKAATIAGINRFQFLQVLAAEKIDVFHVEIQELAEELNRE